MTDIEHWVCENCDSVDGPTTPEDETLCAICKGDGEHGEIVHLVPANAYRAAVKEAEKWKRIAQDRCTCVATCGDTPEDSGGVCKGLARA